MAQAQVQAVGGAAHEAARDALRAQLAGMPPGHPVRLAKRTSNLFRPREATGAPGLDVSDFTHVLSVDPDALVADVQGMTTYEDLVDACWRTAACPWSCRS